MSSRGASTAAVVLALLVNGCGGGGSGGGGGAAVTTAPSPEIIPPPPVPGPDPVPAPAPPPGPGVVSVNVTERATLASPWSIVFLPDRRALVTEKFGTLKLLNADLSIAGNISGVPPVYTEGGQGGLLDVALDPNYSQNHRIYFSFAEQDSANPSLNGTAVGRAVLDTEARTLSSVTVIYRQQPKRNSIAHFGSRLVFDRNGNLFVTMGERFERQFAQDLSFGHGKIAHITTDGAPAPDNPRWTQAGAQAHFWSYGHRNVQGAALHPATGELWISEHGQQGGDEINRVLAGRNYGWPIATFSQEYGTTTLIGPPTAPGTEPPLWVWEMFDGSAWPGGNTPKSSTAPSGITFYTSDAVPQWKGSLFMGALAGTALWRLTLDGNTVTSQERLLFERHQRIRDVEQGPDGALYLLTDDGKLLRYGA